jgi:putative endonuclease
MFYVYLLASKPYGTLYLGTTSDLGRRVWEHKNKLVPGFTKRYQVDRLVWFEVHQSPAAALRREKQIKEWKRDWKINLLERDNPHWVFTRASASEYCRGRTQKPDCRNDRHPRSGVRSAPWSKMSSGAEQPSDGHRPSPVWTKWDDGIGATAALHASCAGLVAAAIRRRSC